MILVDTSVLIDFLRGTKSEESQKFEDILQKGIPFGISPYVMQEILQGAATEKEFGVLQKYLSTQCFYHLKDSIESFASAARIYMECRKKGITIRSTIDCLIAQTAIEHDLMLLHNDEDYRAMSRVVSLRFWLPS